MIEAGRMGDGPAVGLAQTLERLNFKLGRLKTGTPPRLKKDTINFKGIWYQIYYWILVECHVSSTDLVVQNGDKCPVPFSYLNEKVWMDAKDQIPCHMTFTNDKANSIILDNMHLNRHVIEEVTGPRYCPSIESKIQRFGSKPHQVRILLRAQNFVHQKTYFSLLLPDLAWARGTRFQLDLSPRIELYLAGWSSTGSS